MITAQSKTFRQKQENNEVTTGITLYGCEQDEAILFKQLAPRYGVTPTIMDEVLSASTVDLAYGNQCVSVSHKTTITQTLLRDLGKIGVKYISTRSAGFNHIDVDFAKSVGITVGNVAYSPDSVADYTLMLMLMAVRNITTTLNRAAAHDFRLPGMRGKELRDMTIGVIGTGRIGTAVIDRLQGFGCHTLAYDHRQKTTATYVTLDELLQRSDIVTLHTPLNAQTKHLLNRARIALMKPGAFIINTGRGALIDTQALVTALQNGTLGGAALDVIEGEEGIFYADHSTKPIANPALLQLQSLPNVIITPHIAYYTEHALHDIVKNTIINCLTFKKEN
jgi:D-specific alpha-keto acid dehydrogenase